ncbi:MAG TPA: hypothetical protein VF318_05710 [Dehalococcoidales bacterium]
MAYYVRLLTPTEKPVPFNDISLEIGSVKLISGTDSNWEKIEISDPAGSPIAVLERKTVSSDAGGAEMAALKEQVSRSNPENARRWILKYLSTVKTIYSFQLFADNIERTDWPVLGRVQNLLKDALTGIIQADNEGFYNESGDYILWQMYAGAGGSVPAATLDEKGEWIPFQLNLADYRAVERFKRGEMPRRGLFDVFFKR